MWALISNRKFKSNKMLHDSNAASTLSLAYLTTVFDAKSAMRQLTLGGFVGKDYINYRFERQTSTFLWVDKLTSVSGLPTICFLIGQRANVGTPLGPKKEAMQETLTMTFKRIYESNNHAGLAGPVKSTDKIGGLNAWERELRTMSQ